MSVSNPTRSLPGQPGDAAGAVAAGRGLGDILRENGLSLVLIGMFLLTLGGQSVAGWMQHNEDARQHGGAVLGFLPYLLSGHYWEAVFENWESEFLQMAAFVMLTSCLYQKGSAESRKLPGEGENPQEEGPREKQDDPKAPPPVRAGGWKLRLYERSLSLALGLLFLGAFVGHAAAGARAYSQEQLEHGERAVTTLQYLGTSRFWFESMQNWQSEFLAVFTLVVLSIWLREKGSPESKPVATPSGQTGD